MAKALMIQVRYTPICILGISLDIFNKHTKEDTINKIQIEIQWKMALLQNEILL